MPAYPERPSTYDPERGNERPRHIGRRLFLGLLGTGAAALFVPRDIFSRLAPSPLLTQDRGAGQPTTKTFTRFVDSLDPSEIPSPRGRFRIYQVTSSNPRFDEARWRLAVDGMVENPISLTYDQLLALPVATQISDFKCVTGWEVKDIYWEGARIGPILDVVRPKPEATHITFYSGDGAYTESLSLQQANYPEVILAHKMAGRPLSTRQGAPLRVVVPRMFGYKGAKWLTRMELTDRQIRGYWEVRGYSVNGYRS